MWPPADLFHGLPEIGDADRPRLVVVVFFYFFFDEAHLLFYDASQAFRDSTTRTVRLIRSKGVGVFFVTQTAKDVPGDVLARLGNRVQHALRAFTPDAQEALKATVRTFPDPSYDDLEEPPPGSVPARPAVVTVLGERAPRRRWPRPAACPRVADGAGR